MNIKNKLKKILSQIHEKQNSFNVKTLLYLILFSLGIIIFLWIFQVIFLQVSYERYQIKKMNHIASIIEDTSLNSLDNTLLSLAYQHSVCIEYENPYGDTLSYNTLQVGCGLDKNINNINRLKSNLKETNSKKGIKLINPLSKTKAYLYGIKKGSGYVFVYSTLEDIDSASVLLKGQLMYIMIFVLLFACFVAYFLSKKITKPIIGMTNKAKEMGKGNYDLVFQENGTLEIDELARTLNNACKDMKKIDELRRDLLANVSHDLKTPLTMIRAYAEMVRDISYKNEEKRNKDLNIIIEETDRLTILVNDLLELSKLEASTEGQLVLESYDLIPEINKILSKYDIIKETENYTFILEVPEKAIVTADKNKMNQVIYNLVNNAINYTGKDKKVVIKIVDKGKKYLVQIIDTGKGIKSIDLPYIWDKYYKNDKNHKRNVVGTGVGLSIVRNILEAHKFKYGVKGKKPHGAIFFFEIDK